jgi:hypothetical protein
MFSSLIQNMQVRTVTRSQKSAISRIEVLPADGNSAAIKGSGDFGTSPFWGSS